MKIILPMKFYFLQVYPAVKKLPKEKVETMKRKYLESRDSIELYEFMTRSKFNKPNECLKVKKTCFLFLPTVINVVFVCLLLEAGFSNLIDF